MKVARNSKIEFLRIISMLMIIAHHYALYGMKMQTSSSGIDKYVVWLFYPGGVVGVGIFFLIAGYFGFQNNNVKIERVIFKTTSYSILGLVLYFVLNLMDIIKIRLSFEQVSMSLCPIGSSAFWFASVYILLMLCKPAINHFIDQLSPKKIILTLLCGGLIYTILRHINAHYLGIYNGLIFYIIGALAYKYKDYIQKIKGMYYILFAIMGWGGYVLFSSKGGIGGLIAVVVFGTIAACAIAFLFITGKECENRYINKLAEPTLAIYFIHENPLFRDYIWNGIFKVNTFQRELDILPIIAVLTVIAIYYVGAFIEWIKVATLDRVCLKLKALLGSDAM